MSNKPLIIIMGVSGCGKTTIGQLLADKLKIPFYDADDFHPQKNIIKMKDGIPLNDSDRLPWLENLSKKLKDWQVNGTVLACSALKESYRLILKSNLDELNWIYLKGDFVEIKNRLKDRQGHYFKASLLKSQFDDLEIPDYAIKIGIDNPPEILVDNIIEQLKA